MAQSRADITFGHLGYGFQIGINNGTIHLPPERPETPPSPSSNVPFPRDSDYVDRQALLKQVQLKCSIPASRTALVGLGGVGKSQLAIEYSYQTRDRLTDTWVFWVHASNAARFEQSYREIADRVRIAGRKDPKANVVKLVYDWLCDRKDEKWLLILDNVDDARFLYEASPSSQEGSGSGQASRQPLLAYLPQSPNGSILITTRTSEVALKLVEQKDIITVEPMDEAHAVSLFKKKLGMHSNNKDIAELAEALEFMPLAIVQAAAYILQRAPRSSVQQYLEEFRKSDRKKTSLLNHEAGHLRRDWEAKNSIIVTWQISFEHIRQARPSAADLLSLMSCFDRQGIPETLIRCRDLQQNQRKLEGLDVDNEKDSEDDTSKSPEDDGFEEDVLILRNYSFISVNADQITFELHRLVQLATQAWLASHARLKRWQRQFIKNLDFEFPTGEYNNWARCESHFPHAKSAIAQQPDEKDSLQEWASLLNKAAWYALAKGNMSDAEKMAGQAMKASREFFGTGHPSTLTSMNNLALTYRNQGRWDEAEKLQVEVIETHKAKLGADYSDTLTSMNNLALTYGNQGRWDEAEKLQVEVMETHKAKLGADYPSTLTSMNNLALTYCNQGRWDEAEKLLVEVMEMSKTKLGTDHPDTLTSIANLASTYGNQGRWDEAERLEVEVIETRKTKLGADHPSTLNSRANLASTYRKQGRYNEAEKLEIEVMETHKAKLGADHPDTLTSMNNLASTYWNQGRWDEAEKLLVEVIEMSKTKLGTDHPDTLTSIANLASTYGNQGRWDEAERLEVEVIETRKTKLGADHPSTLNSRANLASTYRKQGRWDEAEKLELDVMETRKTKLGADHPDTLTSMANLALTFSNQGRWDEAEKLQVEVIETLKTKLSADHPSTITSMANLASTYWNQGRWDEAEKLLVEVTETLKTKLGVDHPDTLTSMNNLAFTWKSQGRDIEAFKLMEECIQLQTRILGVNHPDTSSSSRTLSQWKSLRLSRRPK